MHKTSQIPSKMALEKSVWGKGREPKKSKTPAGNLFFSDFLILFDVAIFVNKKGARAENIVNTIKKCRSGRVLGSQSCNVFDLINFLKHLKI